MPWTRQQMAQRAAQELRDGTYVNLGIGIPTLVANFIPPGITVTLQSETASSALAPPHRSRVRRRPHQRRQRGRHRPPRSQLLLERGLLAMIRGGHIDLAILGAMQVSDHGDLANWMVPGKMVKGMGGAMDLVSGVQRVLVVMEHTAKDGSPKILRECTLP